jgi:hypothetical protein
MVGGDGPGSSQCITPVVPSSLLQGADPELTDGGGDGVTLANVAAGLLAQLRGLAGGGGLGGEGGDSQAYLSEDEIERYSQYLI